MSYAGSSDIGTIIGDLGQFASEGVDVYAQDQAAQVNQQRLLAGLPPLPVSYFEGTPAASVPNAQAGVGPSAFSGVPMGLNPLLLILLGLGIVYAMDKRK